MSKFPTTPYAGIENVLTICSRPSNVIVVEFVLDEVPASHGEVAAMLLLALALRLGIE